eukprot:3887190-Pyramimonas_sp.AAC.1
MRCACAGFRLEVAQPRERTPAVFSIGWRSDADQPQFRSRPPPLPTRGQAVRAKPLLQGPPSPQRPRNELPQRSRGVRGCGTQ